MNEFERNLYAVLAWSVVYETKQEYSPNGVVDDARCEDPDAPDPGESAAKSYEAYARTLPDILATEMRMMPMLESAKFDTSKTFSPAWADLQNNLYKQFGPQFAQTAQKIDASNKMAGAQADLSVLQGPGKQAVNEVTGMLKATDPEFFALREQTAGTLSDLLGSGLTPAEEEAISRRLARERVDSGISTPTSTDTVAGAMQFGDAARQRTLQGIGAATSFLPASRTGFDPTQIALGRPSINTGDSKFLGVQQPENAKSQSENMFNQAAGFQNNAMQIDAQKRDWMDRLNEGVGSINF